MEHPPGVDAVRRRVLAARPDWREWPTGLVSGLARLALRAAPPDEVAAEALAWGEAWRGEPDGERLTALTELAAGLVFGVPPGRLTPAADPPVELARRLAAQGVGRVWLARGQMLSLADGRRLTKILGEAGLAVRPYGAANRCLLREITAEPGDALLWAASEDFRLAGFVELPAPTECAAFARRLALPAAALLDRWMEPLEAPALPAYLTIVAGCGLVPPGEPAPVPPAPEALAGLFRLLRRRLTPGLPGS